MNATKTFICYLYVCVYYYFHVCSIKFYFFGSFSLKLAYFAAPNWFGGNFQINFNYQRCLENSNMISFGLTSLVTSCQHILYFLFFFIFAKALYHVWWKLSLFLIYHWSSRVCFLVYSINTKKKKKTFCCLGT